MKVLENFYPRSPRGERPSAAAMVATLGRFLSTLPARGATQIVAELNHKDNISIHAPREGSDEAYK